MNLLAVIPTRSNLSGLRSLLTQLDRLGVPVRIYDNGHDSYEAQAFLHARQNVVNARGWKFYKMWNDGWEFASANQYDVVAMLNDDIELDDGSLNEALVTLEANPDYGLLGLNWKKGIATGTVACAEVVEANGSYRVGGVAGWAFLLRANLWGKISPIDQEYHIWYGDDELFALVKKYGLKTGIALGAPVDHEMSATLNLFPELRAKTGEDHDRYMARWRNQ